jgi:hypothetical protein
MEETLNENVRLLSFDEIMGVFRKLVFVKNEAWETFAGSINVEGKTAAGGKAAVTVNRITLGLSRVQSGTQYYLIPVWDFYGTVDYLFSDGTSMAWPGSASASTRWRTRARRSRASRGRAFPST